MDGPWPADDWKYLANKKVAISYAAYQVLNDLFLPIRHFFGAAMALQTSICARSSKTNHSNQSYRRHAGQPHRHRGQSSCGGQSGRQGRADHRRGKIPRVVRVPTLRRWLQPGRRQYPNGPSGVRYKTQPGWDSRNRQPWNSKFKPGLITEVEPKWTTALLTPASVAAPAPVELSNRALNHNGVRSSQVSRAWAGTVQVHGAGANQEAGGRLLHR